MDMLSCKDTTRLVSDSQERKLSLRERLNMRMHLWMCVNCRRFERQMHFMRKALHLLGRRAESDTDGIELSAEARERIRKALNERGGHRH